MVLVVARCHGPSLLSRQPGVELTLCGAPPKGGAAIAAVQGCSHKLKVAQTSVVGTSSNPQHSGWLASDRAGAEYLAHDAGVTHQSSLSRTHRSALIDQHSLSPGS